MICVMSAIKNMMPSKPDSELNKKIHKQMQPIQNKDDDYKENYFAIRAERDALTAEMEEYRNLAHLYDENQKKCDNVIKKSESFMRVVLSRYEEVKRFRAEGRERNVRWKKEREILQNEIKDLLEKIKERDNSIQLSISEKKSLMEQLNNEKRDYQELIEQRRDASNKLEQLERELAWTKGELRDVSSNLESTEQDRMKKTKELDDHRIGAINVIRTKTEEFDQYMDKVGDLHSEINSIILRYNPLIIPSDPVCINIPEQLEAMKESITQLDELTANVLTRNITREAMDALNRDNEQLREQLEDLFATTQTLKINARFNEMRKQELDKNVNSYASKELARQQQIHILHNRKIELTAENNDYQDQIKMLQKEIHILRAECDSARNGAEEVRSYLDPQSCVQQLCHENSKLKKKVDDIRSQAAERTNHIQQLRETIDRAKMTLRKNIHIIENSNCLMALLNELENRLPPNLECRDNLIS